jgi:quinol monooxygenase YgiN
MSISLLVAGLGCLGALAATGLLVARCLRAPSAALVAWTIAEFGLAVSLVAQASGHAVGFGPVAFRAMEIGAGVLAPLALAVGLTEVAGKSLPVRFAVRLILSAIAFVDLVILGSDPLSAAAFSKAWPGPLVYYQVIPDNLLQYTAPIAVAVALIAALCTAIRLQRNRAWQAAVQPVAAAAVATLAASAPGLALLAAANQVGTSLPVGSLVAPLCVVAAALTWYACLRLGSLHAGLLRHGAAPEDADEWAEQRSWTVRSDETGGFEPLGADADPYGGLYHHRDDDSDYDVAAYAGPGLDPGGYAVKGAYRGAEPGAGYDDDTGYSEVPAGYGEDDAGSRLFGQIAIYTLLEDRVTPFDRLTRHVVKQVKANEPDTLVFIVHAVPSAPMQRILYEVYRDRAAYEQHKRQPYLAQFEIDRRAYVLATNVIELGLQQAKVSPLPSISDLLTDTGFDLLNDTGFGQPGFAPRSVPLGAAGSGGLGSGGPVLGGPGNAGSPDIAGQGEPGRGRRAGGTGAPGARRPR